MYVRVHIYLYMCMHTYMYMYIYCCKVAVFTMRQESARYNFSQAQGAGKISQKVSSLLILLSQITKVLNFENSYQCLAPVPA